MKNIFVSLFSLLLVVLMPQKIMAEDNLYVYDWMNVLDEEVENIINENNRSLQEVQDASIYVVTIDTLGKKDVQEATDEIADKIGLTAEKMNQVVLLVLAIEDETYFCFNGENIFEPINGNLFYIYLEEDFKAGRYSEGVERTFDNMYRQIYTMKESIVEEKENVPVERGMWDNEKANEGLLFCLLIIVIVIGLFILTKPFGALGSGILRKGKKTGDYYSESFRETTLVRHDNMIRPKLDHRYVDGQVASNIPEYGNGRYKDQ